MFLRHEAKTSDSILKAKFKFKSFFSRKPLYRLNSRGMQAGTNEIVLRHDLLLILIGLFLLFCGHRVFTRPHTQYHIYCHKTTSHFCSKFFSCVLTRKVPVLQTQHVDGPSITKYSDIWFLCKISLTIANGTFYLKKLRFHCCQLIVCCNLQTYQDVRSTSQDGYSPKTEDFNNIQVVKTMSHPQILNR